MRGLLQPVPLLAALLLALPMPARAADAAPGDRSGAAAPPPAEPGPGRPAGALAVVEGTVRAVDLAKHSLVIGTGGEAIALRLDRNTLVYLPGGLSTVFELTPGDAVRTGYDDRGVAFWVQVRAGSSRTPAPSPAGRGTGPGGGSPPPPEGGAAVPFPAGAGRVP